MSDVNLDTFREENGFSIRLETSATLQSLRKKIKEDEIFFWREGLGEWRAFRHELAGVGSLIFAAPNDLAEAGATIWLQPEAGIKINSLVDAIWCLFFDENLQFMDPSSGDILIPSHEAMQKTHQIIRKRRLSRLDMIKNSEFRKNFKISRINSGQYVVEFKNVKRSRGFFVRGDAGNVDFIRKNYSS
jgi:hypothetical protein